MVGFFLQFSDEESYLRTLPLNARVKDRLENRLHALVCAGKLSLPAAQQAIATDYTQRFTTLLEQAGTITLVSEAERKAQGFLIAALFTPATSQ
jgi:hypothetical protein